MWYKMMYRKLEVPTPLGQIDICPGSNTFKLMALNILMIN